MTSSHLRNREQKKNNHPLTPLFVGFSCAKTFTHKRLSIQAQKSMKCLYQQPFAAVNQLCSVLAIDLESPSLRTTYCILPTAKAGGFPVT